MDDSTPKTAKPKIKTHSNQYNDMGSKFVATPEPSASTPGSTDSSSASPSPTPSTQPSTPTSPKITVAEAASSAYSQTTAQTSSSSSILSSEPLASQPSSSSATLNPMPIASQSPDLPPTKPVISHSSISASSGSNSSYIGGAPVTSGPLVINPLDALKTEKPAERPKSTIPTPTVHREFGIVKFLRILIWLAATIALTLGVSLLVRSRSSEAFAGGLSAGLREQSENILRIALIAGGVNLLWGMFRWFRRWHRERWRFTRVLRKLIGGGLIRIAVFTIITAVSFLFVAPFFDSRIISDTAPQLAHMQNVDELIANNSAEGVDLSTITMPQGEVAPCTDFCEMRYEITPNTSQYLYFATSEYQDRIITMTAPVGQDNITVFGHVSGGLWQVIGTYESEITYAISAEVSTEYDAIIFAVQNYAPDLANEFYLRVQAAELTEVMSVSLFNLNDESFVYGGNNCTAINIDTSGLMQLPMKFYDILTSLGQAQDYASALADIQDQLTPPDGTPLRYATICIIPLKPDTTYETAKVTAGNLLGWNLQVLNLETTDFRFGALVNYDLVQNLGEFYFVVDNSSECTLVQLQFSDKLSRSQDPADGTNPPDEEVIPVEPNPDENASDEVNSDELTEDSLE